MGLPEEIGILTPREIDCWVIMGTLNIRGVDVDTIETIFEVDEVDPINLPRIFYTIESSIPQEHKEGHESDLPQRLRELPRESLLKLVSPWDVGLETFLMMSTKKSPRADNLISSLSPARPMSKSDLAKLIALHDGTLDHDEGYQPELDNPTRDLDVQGVENKVQRGEAHDHEQQKYLEKEISETANFPTIQNKLDKELRRLEDLETLRRLGEENHHLEEELRRFTEDPLHSEEHRLRTVSHYVKDILSPALHCTVFITKLGLLGVGDPGLKKGDKVTILFGIPMPIILRSSSAPCYHTMVGKAGVGEIMNGELMKYIDDGLLKERLFHIR